MTPGRADRAEAVIQVLILLAIAGMAAAASFTHVHDWTMRNSPAGTGSWFGWANAIISELTPTAAGIEIRRRKRQHRPVAYPMAVLIAAAVLSLAAQVAQARHSLTGWLLAAVPALAFLALTKLVLARAPSNTASITTSADTVPASLAVTPASGHADDTPDGQLLFSARTAAFAHHQATGQPITPGTLAEHLGIPADLAGTLLHHLDGAPPPVTTVNGTAPGGSRP